ncbi:MAG: pyridoxamine 5'-phosphate oxidase [Zymomonas mobilis subsp. pomaceae]|uniref:Pyridoxine/pyridoxamine 5'-phosphate oxidase n=1 Tax=Zymomonas mobilis subsp. pomaceae (strain ATCC 29192 / DSM 22645 / JCM 10191 / CCUG 17912 / NBRC 13757 / NCIMB 11200 / NRRL B-4491 / Barker I) TaxID=579138 RepID=F8EVB0_ZYMMT|nr:pyridoxamine 5'-phosphate oxidase [Zymomonas mobilis]AEI37317.1 pyridoxamine 5'-phosphate oxidase [Zymomonas mobilis subsp. pomaceae ATCC 29192]MDX5948685.1 pyridoxamine 5'-phosphate oxidase [Zymomonas mobilis subsp. pomaceae]GEB88490.1 pyridoxine/pyridoxamine 5'-phosphate oxidase [Zymomonas mobilis subsp. pomaceae]
MTQDPHKIFDDWMDEAKKAETEDPTAMALATASKEGFPCVRMMLLKGHDERGFVFYTNLGSRKGHELLENPVATLLFYWKNLRRQLRVEGPVTLISDAEADAYFASRARKSQLGAWASEQSRPLPARDVFEKRIEDITARYEGKPVPRPPYWTGFRLAPVRMEFWNDREFRLHERELFTLNDGRWQSEFLYP